MMMSESTLERDLLILMEFDLSVEKFEEQPIRIEYLDSEGNLRTYTPDLLVFYRTDLVPAKNRRPMLVEVKYRRNLFSKWAELKPKFKAARKYARENGWEFHIITEKEIRTPYLENDKFLLRYRNTAIDWVKADLLLRNIENLKDSTPRQLIEVCSSDKIEQAELINCLWQLISRSYIGAEIEISLTMKSPLWSVNQFTEG